MKRAISLAVLALALLAIGGFLDALVSETRFPAAHRWSASLPLGAFGALALVLGAGCVLRRSLAELAAGALAVALAVHAIADLPRFAANAHFADGPHQAWPLLLIGLALGLFAAAGPRSWRADERLAALLVIAWVGAGNLFSRQGEGVWSLLATGVLLHLATAPWQVERFAGRGMRIALALGAALVAWVFVAGALGDHPGLGYRVGLRVLTLALFALSLAACLDRRGVARSSGAILVGTGAVLCLSALDVFVASLDEPWQRVFATRLRALGMHPNGIGPLFAAGLVLGAAWCFAARARGAQLICLLLALGSAAALFATQSRASLAGLGVGALVLAAGLAFGPLRRGATAAAAAGLALALCAASAAAIAWTPPGERLVAALETRTHTPSAVGQRWYLWRTSAAAIAERPLVGQGPNQYYTHTRFARPSYYDGSDQDLHPHNLPLAIAEGAGLPALLLALALALFACEALRRAAAAAEDRRARALAVGLAAYGAVFLAANQLDLGQSQAAFLPQWGWIVLGLAGALAAASRAGNPQAPAPSAQPFAQRARVAAALVLLLPLAAQPLAGQVLDVGAQAAIEAGRPEDALAAARLALAVAPQDPRPRLVRVRALRQLGEGDALLEELGARAAVHPLRAGPHAALAREQLARGRVAEALVSVRRALELDPRGPSAPDWRLLEGAAELAAGREPAGRAALLEGLWAGSGALGQLPLVRLQTGAGAPPGARPRALAVGGARRAPLPVADLLVDLETRLLEAVSSDPVGARRAMRPLVGGWVMEGRPDLALAALENHRAAGGTQLPSLLSLELDLLATVGRVDEALALLAAHPPSPFLRGGLARGELANPDPRLEAAARAGLERDLAQLLGQDLFFTGGSFQPMLRLAERLARQDGDAAGARSFARRLRREWSEPLARLAASREHLDGLLEIGADPKQSLGAIADWLADLSLLPALGDRGAVERMARTWSASLPEGDRDRWRDIARGRLAGRGPAQDRFAAALGGR